MNIFKFMIACFILSAKYAYSIRVKSVSNDVADLIRLVLNNKGHAKVIKIEYSKFKHDSTEEEDGKAYKPTQQSNNLNYLKPLMKLLMKHKKKSQLIPDEIKPFTDLTREEPNLFKGLKKDDKNSRIDTSKSNDLHNFVEQERIRNPKQLITDRNNKYRNRVLVKRIIPHKTDIGLQDQRIPTLYRPLFKIHNVETLNDLARGKPNSLNYVRDLLDALGAESVENLDDIRKKILLKEIMDTKTYLSNSVNDQNFGDIEDAYIRSRNKKYADDYEYDYDLIGPGVKVIHTNEDDKFKLPYLPPWNYWTYKKKVYQDVCPPGTVQAANTCIWTPPH